MAKVSPLQALSERHLAHEEVQGKTGGEVWKRAKLFFIPNWVFFGQAHFRFVLATVPVVQARPPPVRAWQPRARALMLKEMLVQCTLT